MGGRASGSGGSSAGGRTDGAGGSGGSGPPPVLVPVDGNLRLEAESATISGGATVGTSATVSNSQYVDLQATGRLDFALQVEAAGFYALQINAAVPGAWGQKLNDVYVNEVRLGSFTTDDQNATSAYYLSERLWLPLQAGVNTLSIRASWGYTRLDYLELAGIRKAPTEPAPLVNANASEGAQRLMSYLRDTYTQKLIAGQQGISYVNSIRTITGREPALVGFDLMDYSSSRVSHGAKSREIEDAINWWNNRHGIVTVCWHWNAPTKLYDDMGREWWRGFYTNATYFDLQAALADTNSDDYRALITDIDTIAIQLQKLEDAGVPVLFRPLHEASGGWFWWGAKGPAPYLTLWYLLYDRLTNLHQLDNLIWVWNGQAATWYPGDAFVDIIGEDVYARERDYSPQIGRFSQALGYTSAYKLVTLSETGGLLDPDRWLQSPATWSWFMTWSGEEFIVNEVWNENSTKRLVYNHDAVITLDELPDLGVYPIE